MNKTPVTWIVTFVGRNREAIGKSSNFTVSVLATTAGEAKLQVYKTHDHVECCRARKRDS